MGLLAAVTFAAATAVDAAPLKTLHSFTECAGGKCQDGSAPSGNLVMDLAAISTEPRHREERAASARSFS